MRKLLLAASALALAVLALALPAFAQEPPHVKGAEQYNLRAGPKTTAELEAAIAKADSDLFDAVFIQCDAEKAGGMIADDFRFYHDKDGLSETSKAHFVADLKAGCARQAKGTDFHARRELVPGTMQVWPINKFGAVELGVHRFYARIPGKPDQLTETGNFVILWKNVDGKWLMAETISYGHKLAE